MHSDDFVVAQHRNGDDAAETAKTLGLRPFVSRVGEDVGDQHRPAVEPDPPDESSLPGEMDTRSDKARYSSDPPDAVTRR